MSKAYRSRIELKRALRALSVVLLLGCATPGAAASLRVSVLDADGHAVEDAVVLLDGTSCCVALNAPVTPAVMDQHGKQFVPHVLPVRVGTPVTFPNSDDIRHHVYSFSETKRFEIRLYRGVPSEPLVFDRPGVATLGCNIHDWMLGYIYVSDTPFFVKIGADGRGRIDDLPADRYDIRVWHPRLAEDPGTLRTLDLAAADEADIGLQVALQPVMAGQQQPPDLLTEKFRRHRRDAR